MTNSRDLKGDPRQISAPAAVLAIGATVAALLLLAALHVLSPEFSPAWRLVSEYANGRYGWVMRLMFAAYGLSSLTLAFAIRSQLTTRSAKIGLVSLVVAGIGQAAAAVFDINLVVLHYLAGALGVVAMPIGAVLISRALVKVPEWTVARKPIVWVAHLTWISIVLLAAAFVVMVATFQIALGALPSAPPTQLPAGVVALVGWPDRLIVLSAWTWVTIVAVQAIRVRSAIGSSARVRTLQPARGADDEAR